MHAQNKNENEGRCNYPKGNTLNESLGIKTREHFWWPWIQARTQKTAQYIQSR